MGRDIDLKFPNWSPSDCNGITFLRFQVVKKVPVVSTEWDLFEKTCEKIISKKCIP